MTEERVTDLSPKCQACGTPFQSVDPLSRGFFKEVSAVSRGTGVKTSTLDKYNHLMANLDEQSQSVLLQERQSDLEEWEKPLENGEEPVTEKLRLTIENSDKIISKSQSDTRKETVNRGLCTSCREVKGGKYAHFIEDRLSDQVLISKIPKDATIIHVISGMDFPASVNLDIKDIAAGRKIIWVVTKSDMVVADNVKTSERLLPYVQEELDRLVGADPEDVYVVSAKRSWDVGTLYHALPSNGYLVGYANTGKTTLAQALASKDNNRTLVPAQLSQRTVGANEIPGMTRHEISYVLKGKRVVDMPPIGHGRDAIYSVVRHDMIKDLVRGKPFLRKSGLLTTKRVVLSKPGNTLSIAGLVFIRFVDTTEKLSLITWAPCARHDDVVVQFRDYEKAVSRAAEQKDFHSAWFFSKPYEPGSEFDLTPVKVMDIKVPKGGADLSILGLGHVQLRGNGPIPKDGASVEVYAVPGVHVVQTVPLLPFLKDFKEQPRELKKGRKRRQSN